MVHLCLPAIPCIDTQHDIQTYTGIASSNTVTHRYTAATTVCPLFSHLPLFFRMVLHIQYLSVVCLSAHRHTLLCLPLQGDIIAMKIISGKCATMGQDGSTNAILHPYPRQGKVLANC